jgi:hypothetical protein
MQQLVKQKNITISYVAEGNYFYADWIGDQSEADIRGGGEQMIATMKRLKAQFGCTKVINDNRRVTGIWGHSVEWAANEWLPAMVAAGLESFAWILSPAAMTNMSGLRLRLKGGDTAAKIMSTFTDEQQAKNWLKGR